MTLSDPSAAAGARRAPAATMLLLLALLALALLPAPARGMERGELQLGAGPALGRALLPGEPENAPALLAHAALGLGAQLGVDASFGAARHGLLDDFGFAALCLRYQVDISGWEPYLLAGGGVYRGTLPAGIPLGRYGLQLGAGLLARVWARPLAPGAELRYHAFFADLESYPHYFTIGLRLDGILQVF